MNANSIQVSLGLDGTLRQNDASPDRQIRNATRRRPEAAGLIRTR